MERQRRELEQCDTHINSLGLDAMKIAEQSTQNALSFNDDNSSMYGSVVSLQGIGASNDSHVRRPTSILGRRSDNNTRL